MLISHFYIEKTIAVNFPVYSQITLLNQMYDINIILMRLPIVNVCPSTMEPDLSLPAEKDYIRETSTYNTAWISYLTFSSQIKHDQF